MLFCVQISWYLRHPTKRRLVLLLHTFVLAGTLVANESSGESREVWSFINQLITFQVGVLLWHVASIFPPQTSFKSCWFILSCSLIFPPNKVIISVTLLMRKKGHQLTQTCQPGFCTCQYTFAKCWRWSKLIPQPSITFGFTPAASNTLRKVLLPDSTAQCMTLRAGQ